jgi:phage tail protein X
VSGLYGAVHLTLSAAPPSVGLIEETVNANVGTLDLRPFEPSGTANSFFDVFFNLNLPGLGVTLHNADAVRLQSLISHKPPGPGEPYSIVSGADLLDRTGLQDRRRARTGHAGPSRHGPCGSGKVAETADRSRRT